MNNAGANMFELTHERTVLVMETNYYGVKKVIKGLLPLLRASPAGARIVNVSSRAGRMRVRKGIFSSFPFKFSVVYFVCTMLPYHIQNCNATRFWLCETATGFRVWGFG